MSGVGSPDFFYREAQRLGYVARSAFKLIEIQKQFKLIAPGSSVLDLGCAPGAWLQVACQNLGPLEKGGAVVGIDLKKVKVPSSHCDSRVRTLCADVMSLLKKQARTLSPQIRLWKVSQQISPQVASFIFPGNHVDPERGFSVVLSDMCPVVSGITTRDAALSCELGMRALSLAVGKVRISGLADNANIANFLSTSELDADEDGVLRSGGNLVIKFLESEDIPGFGKFCKPRFKKVSWSRPKATRSCSREIYLICQGLR